MNELCWDELKGKDFVGEGKGGMGEMVGEYVVKKEGIDLKEDVGMIENIDFGKI